MSRKSRLPFRIKAKLELERRGLYVLWHGDGGNLWTLYDKTTGKSLLTWNSRTHRVQAGGKQEASRFWPDVLMLALERRQTA